MYCSKCGSRTNDDDIVCRKCSTLLTLSADELERVEQYRLSQSRELLGIVYADISDFTGITERNPELSQKILAVHRAMMAAIVERGGVGEVVDTTGDGLLAVFSSPVTAVERALEMQAAVSQYHQAMLIDEYLVKALKVAGQASFAAAGEEPYAIHIGVHLGLVTRGGRTSRELFGYITGVACRLCELAGAGQTYLSDTVYENVRLIMGERAELDWQVWKEVPGRGGAVATMTVVGVAQTPYHTLAPPRQAASRPSRESPLITNIPVLAACVIGLALIGGLVGLTVRHLVYHDNVRPAVEQKLPENGSTDTSTDPFAASSANSSASAIAQTTPNFPAHVASENSALPPPVPATPHEAALTAVPGTAEIDQFKLEMLKSGELIQFGNEAEKVPATISAMSSKDALLLAVSTNQPAGDKAEMGVVIDGDHDDKLQTQRTDFLLRTPGPGTVKSESQFLPYTDGKPGIPQPMPEGIAATAQHTENRAVWLFRIPYSVLGEAHRKAINFGLEYWPEGKEKASLSYPKSGLRALTLPE